MTKEHPHHTQRDQKRTEEAGEERLDILHHVRQKPHLRPTSSPKALKVGESAQ